MASTTVQAAVAAVMGDLKGIEKDGGQGLGYKFRSIEQVTKEVRPLFAKHGVVIVPRATLFDTRPCPGMKENWQDIYMSVEWTIIGPDGSTLTANTIGIGRDNSDKGANKAMTQAYKYLLLDLLVISDPDDDTDGKTFAADEAKPPSNVTDLKGRMAEKAGKPKLASRKDHDEVIGLVNELADGPKATFREWYKAQVAENGFPEGGLSNRLLNDDQLASCREMVLQAARPLTTKEIQEAFDATDASMEPFE